MTPEQIQQIIAALRDIATMKPYTITGAADWPLLLVVGGILVAVLGAMWVDLRSTMREGRCEWQKAVNEHGDELDKQVSILWQSMRDCQADCCPRGKKS